MMTEQQAIERLEEMKGFAEKLSTKSDLSNPVETAKTISLLVALLLRLCSVVIYLLHDNIKIKAALRSRGSKI